jgi:glutathione S-transferase
MIKLCGFGVSNYYNKAKIALLAKGIAFEEEYVGVSHDSLRLQASPARKIPFLDVDGVVLSESQAISEYLEDAYPQPALYPSGAMERARCRELIQIIELYLELPARRLYREAFFGGTVSQEVKDLARPEIERGARALAATAKFAPYIAGSAFTFADCAAAVHLPVVSMAGKKIYGTDPLEAIDSLGPYLELLAMHPAVGKTREDRKKAEAAMIAARAKTA